MTAQPQQPKPKPKLRPVDQGAHAASRAVRAEPVERMKLTADRILVRIPDQSERKSKGGLLIPATAATPVRRCLWSDVVLVGPDSRNVKTGDRVLFIPQAGLEVEWSGDTYLLLRERDVQAVASDRVDAQAGQYL